MIRKIFLKFTDLQKISTEDDDTNLQVNPKHKNGQTLRYYLPKHKINNVLLLCCA